MMNYSVGDKVLCLTDHQTNNGNIRQYIYKGNYYIVRGMKMCSCGLIAVDIGMILATGENTICNCRRGLGEGTWWFHHNRFTKEDSNQQSESDETLVSKDETVDDFMEIFSKTGSKIK